MKKYMFLAVIFAALVFTPGCKKDEKSGPCMPEAGSGQFYRIEGYGEVDLVPAKSQVRMLIRVSDENKVGVPNLGIQDFVLKENCVDKVNDLESKTQIDRKTIPVKVKTVLLLDVSSSMDQLIPQMKTAVNALIDGMLDNQELAIYSFDKKVSMVHDYSADKTSLKAKVAAIQETDLIASTNLYQAMLDGAASWEDNFGVNEITFGSMIVFTDGKHNTDPTLTKDKVKAVTKDKAVFIAALKSPNLAEAELKEIAGSEENYALATEIDALEGVFKNTQEKVEREANSVYFLTYTSPIGVPGEQDLLLYLKNNKNSGGDNHVRRKFKTDDF